MPKQPSARVARRPAREKNARKGKPGRPRKAEGAKRSDEDRFPKLTDSQMAAVDKLVAACPDRAQERSKTGNVMRKQAAARRRSIPVVLQVLAELLTPIEEQDGWSLRLPRDGKIVVVPEPDARRGEMPFSLWVATPRRGGFDLVRDAGKHSRFRPPTEAELREREELKRQHPSARVTSDKG